MSQTLDINTYQMTYNTSKHVTERIKRNQFGDGYNQYLFDGLNHTQEEWNVEFAPMSTDSTTYIDLETLLQNSTDGTSNVLKVKMPNESEYKYYTAWDIQRVILGPTTIQITCTFKREYPIT